MSFKDLTIRSRLMIGFALVTAMLLLFIGINSFSISHGSQKMEKSYTKIP